MEIAVVGGGLAGLTAAHLLAEKHQVTVFEKENCLGGLASCFRAKNWEWPLERYYHHFFASDREVLNLSRQLGLSDKVFFESPKTSIMFEGKIYRSDRPQSVFAFPKLTLADKVRLGLTSLFLKINPFWQPLEKITAFDFIQKFMGKNVFNLIWKPLLDNKFGSSASQIPASWFLTRIQKRSFALGYFTGGTQTLIDALAAKIRKANGQIVLGSEVKKTEKIGRLFELTAGRRRLKFDRVIVTGPPSTLLAISPQLSSEEKKSLSGLKSLGSLCLVLSLKESFLTDGTYWLNINNSEFPFVAVVEHTNYIDKRYYQNEHLLYVGGYYDPNHRIFKMTKDQVFEKFLPWLNKINPGYDFALCTLHFALFTNHYSQPIVGRNYSSSRPKITTSVSGLFWGSLHHVYPQDRGINYAIKLGKEIANEVENS